MFLLLSKYKEYKIIFTTLSNIRIVFTAMIASQFSFFLIFSTISIIILGGKIRIDQYKKNLNIPEYYAHLNFNSYVSSFLTCFTFMMINNINVSYEAFAEVFGGWIKIYFTIFYFLGVMIILNILQTYILDMYLNTKKSKTK